MNKTQDTLEPVVIGNRDPIAGEPGSHPVSTGVGSAGGAAAGAAAGAPVCGPVGAVTATKAGQRFEEVESELERTWPTARGNSPYE
jgi:hypothetical protein